MRTVPDSEQNPKDWLAHYLIPHGEVEAARYLLRRYAAANRYARESYAEGLAAFKARSPKVFDGLCRDRDPAVAKGWIEYFEKGVYSAESGK